ncbi:hypothetical protein KSS87_021142 [Heliosperma pusillum]|nr:hypothetical protein KSS87_000397 [Heliosperma pusillum]KAH9614925.1 hypothetical protein KSS87_021142 [Heliosperma pusillum]
MNFEGFSHLKIHAPNLEFFDIGGIFQGVTFENTRLLTVISIGLYVNAPADLSTVKKGTSNLLKFFSHIPQIQRLEVQSYFLKYLAIGNVPGRLPVACLSLNYLSMRINFNDHMEIKTAFCLFTSSPNLFELEMLARPDEESTTHPPTSFWAGNNDSGCLFDNLRIARVFDISSTKPELDFLKFLLANSPKLEKLTIKPGSVDGGMEFLKELLRYRRASVLAEIIYMDT